MKFRAHPGQIIDMDEAFGGPTPIVYWDKNFIEQLKVNNLLLGTCSADAVRSTCSQTEQKPCEGCGARQFTFSSGRKFCLYCHGEA